MKIEFYAGLQAHFSDHLSPLWLALPEEYRGGFFAQSFAAKQARKLGVDVTEAAPNQIPKNATVVVASYEDYHTTRPRPVVMVNHGAGQRYWGVPTDSLAYRHSSYSGGKNRERIVLNICPSEADAAINRQFYPEATSVAVGSPRLDPWHRGERKHLREPGLVAISMHLDAHVCKETRWAMPHYQEAIEDLARSNRFDLIGHGHPRMQLWLKSFWEGLRVHFVPDFADVLDRTSLYVIDNSSSMYEAASVGIPVLTLNAPIYRRDVNHGLRYWNAIPGLAIDTPEELVPGIAEALADAPALAEKRGSAVRVAYSDGQGRLLTDGKATERAVTALIELAESLSG